LPQRPNAQIVYSITLNDFQGTELVTHLLRRRRHGTGRQHHRELFRPHSAEACDDWTVVTGVRG
jgi:hypothetical protein